MKLIAQLFAFVVPGLKSQDAHILLMLMIPAIVAEWFVLIRAFFHAVKPIVCAPRLVESGFSDLVWCQQVI